ncbi:MAG TPA: GDSL-type esterase/lipase family protein [Chitinophagaceae bacterium]|nr:GDSL-type esterase/lipase family protein [Chitinophagaceae bacterium]
MLLRKTSSFILLVSLQFFAPYTASAQLRIVCIGNSITQGKTGLKKDSSYEYSYRPWLWEKLISTGFKVDMVGFHPYFFDEREGQLSMNFKANGVSFDRDCEAYYGITSAAFVNGSESKGWTGAPLPKFADRINSEKKGYTPDIALIHMGTNDKDSTTEQVAATRKNIGEIIRVLRNKNPAVVVIVAKLITGWKKINGQIDALCRDWNTKQSPVVAVDMATGFINDPKVEGTMTYDHVHPNKAGQLFMMERWYNAIVQNLKDAVPPSMQGKLVVAHQSRNRVTVSWRAANDNYGIKAYEVLVNGKLADTTSPNIQNYTFQGLQPGRQYKILVRAKDWRGNRSNGIVATATIKK